MVSITHHPAIPSFYDIDGPERGTKSAPAFQGVEQQLLRILRCTARAMASTPGGLRFSPGARPWLDGLTPSHPGVHAGGGGRDGGVSLPTIEIQSPESPTATGLFYTATGLCNQSRTKQKQKQKRS